MIKEEAPYSSAWERHQRAHAKVICPECFYCQLQEKVKRSHTVQWLRAQGGERAKRRFLKRVAKRAMAIQPKKPEVVMGIVLKKKVPRKFLYEVIKAQQETINQLSQKKVERLGLIQPASMSEMGALTKNG